MSDCESTIRHFEAMARLAVCLKTLPAEVLEHHYSNESFGSWAITIRYRGRPLRLVFDGREREYVLEACASRREPDTWTSIWRHADATGIDPCDPSILDAIRRGAVREAPGATEP